MNASRTDKGSRTSVQITPCPRTLWRRPSLSMTPQPVRSVPQSMPRTRISRECFHLVFVDVEVRIDVLHVVVFFERLAQAQHAARVLPFQANQVLGNHAELSRSGRNPGLMNGLQHSLVRLGSGDDLPVGPVVAQILGAGIEHQIHELVFRGLFAFDDDVALALEHPGDTALLAQVPAVLGENMADIPYPSISIFLVGPKHNPTAPPAPAFAPEF